MEWNVCSTWAPTRILPLKRQTLTCVGLQCKQIHFPFRVIGDECNLFFCHDLILEFVRFGIRTKWTMHLLSLGPVIYRFFAAHTKPRSTFPNEHYVSFSIAGWVQHLSPFAFGKWFLFFIKWAVIFSFISAILRRFQTTFPPLSRLPAHLSPAPFILLWEYS